MHPELDFVPFVLLQSKPYNTSKENLTLNSSASAKSGVPGNDTVQANVLISRRLSPVSLLADERILRRTTGRASTHVSPVIPYFANLVFRARLTLSHIESLSTMTKYSDNPCILERVIKFHCNSQNRPEGRPTGFSQMNGIGWHIKF